MADGPTVNESLAWASRCESWQQTAREFVVAANYLIDWYDPPRSPGAPADLSFGHSGSNLPMMVLFATAVENLLKALRVARHGAPTLDVDGKISGDFATHNLVHHARRADLDVTEDERLLLEHLRDLTEAGRYPVARVPGTRVAVLRFEYPRDVERVWVLLERLEAVLRETGQTCLPPTDVRARWRPPGYAVAEEA